MTLAALHPWTCPCGQLNDEHAARCGRCGATIPTDQHPSTSGCTRGVPKSEREERADGA